MVTLVAKAAKKENAPKIDTPTWNVRRNPKASPTYRSGKVGGWREVFSEDHKLRFKETAGDILIKLGYEKDQNW